MRGHDIQHETPMQPRRRVMVDTLVTKSKKGAWGGGLGGADWRPLCSPTFRVGALRLWGRGAGGEIKRPLTGRRMERVCVLIFSEGSAPRMEGKHLRDTCFPFWLLQIRGRIQNDPHPHTHTHTHKHKLWPRFPPSGRTKQKQR